jgi:hypothetical protein
MGPAVHRMRRPHSLLQRFRVKRCSSNDVHGVGRQAHEADGGCQRTVSLGTRSSRTFTRNPMTVAVPAIGIARVARRAVNAAARQERRTFELRQRHGRSSHRMPKLAVRVRALLPNYAAPERPRCGLPRTTPAMTNRTAAGRSRWQAPPARVMTAASHFVRVPDERGVTA